MALTKNDILIITNLLDERILPLQSDISEVKTDVAELKTDVSVLKTDTAELKIENFDIKENLYFMQEHMVVKEDLKNFLTKDDATKLAQDTANLVMEKMQDQFKLFNDKTLYIDGHLKDHRRDISHNTDKIEVNSMKILKNSKRINFLEKV